MLKKVAHFIHTDGAGIGGAERIVLESVRSLPDYGFAPEVFHFGNEWLEESCNEMGIPITLVPGKKYFSSPKYIPVFAYHLRKLLKARKVDLLHSHLLGPIMRAPFATVMSGVPHVGTLHDTYTIEERVSRIWFLRLASFLGTRLVTVSQTMQDYFRSLTKFSDNAFTTILNGTDADNFRASNRGATRKSLNLNPDDIAIICVGRIVPIKGHDVLINAIAQLQTTKNVKLFLAGDGTDKPKIEDLVKSKNLQNKVEFLGLRDDIPALLKASDIFVLSSHSEGLSCSITEAMAAGLPVVATDVGGNYELVNQDNSGYLVPANDPQAFASSLQLVINNEGLRKEFSANSLSRASQRFSLKTMMQNYTDLYKSLL